MTSLLLKNTLKEKLIDNFSDEIMLKNISKFLDENIYL